MKKVLVLILILCLVACVSVPALAAGKPRISEQPVSATTDEKGNVSFSVKASNIEGLTWRFVNPETGEEITGKNLPKKIKGIEVQGANKKTITLKNVPAEMNDWTVYCQIYGNGYKVSSDRVTLLVYGMSDPEPSVPATGSDVDVEPVTVPDQQSIEPAPAPVPENVPDTAAPENVPAVPGPADTAVAPAEVIPESTTFTVRGENVTLYPMDAYGNRIEDEAATVLTFEDNANIAVQAGGDVKYWTVNGMRIEVSLSAFTLRNVTTDLTISAALAGGTASESDQKLVHISCEGCTFTYGKGGLKNQTEGDVPAGAAIIVIAGSNAAAGKGYSINGGSFEHAGESSFRLTVTGDTDIRTK